MKRVLYIIVTLSMLSCGTNPKQTENETVEQTECKAVEQAEHEAVDLGLSVKWATCNLGANKPTDFGDYFAYGETQTKESYSPLTYKWYEGTNSFYIIKYGVLSIPDESGFIQTLLELEDDAAYVKLGGIEISPEEFVIESIAESSKMRYNNQDIKKINGGN